MSALIHSLLFFFFFLLLYIGNLFHLKELINPGDWLDRWTLTLKLWIKIPVSKNLICNFLYFSSSLVKPSVILKLVQSLYLTLGIIQILPHKFYKLIVTLNKTQKSKIKNCVYYVFSMGQITSRNKFVHLWKIAMKKTGYIF